MEFVELMLIAKKLCRVMEKCTKCPLGPIKNGISLNCAAFFREHPLEAQEHILAWKTEYDLAHSKTLAQKFKEIFPDSPITDYPEICPAILGKSFTGPDWKAEDHCGNGCKSCWETRILDPDT